MYGDISARRESEGKIEGKEKYDGLVVAVVARSQNRNWKRKAVSLNTHKDWGRCKQINEIYFILGLM